MLGTMEDAHNLGNAVKYRSGPVSIDAPPFNSYSHYTWVQLSWMECGAFVYEVKGDDDKKILYYHTCG